MESIREVHGGGFSPERTVVRYPGVARHALMVLSQPPDPNGLNPLAPVLDNRERQALGNLSEGVTPEAIGERMGIQEQGLREVLESAYRKLVARHHLVDILDRVR